MKYPRISWEIGWYGNGLNEVANLFIRELLNGCVFSS
jgi:hypothetical protein